MEGSELSLEISSQGPRPAPELVNHNCQPPPFRFLFLDLMVAKLSYLGKLDIQVHANLFLESKVLMKSP